VLSSYAAYQYVKANGIGMKKGVAGDHIYITGAGSGIGKLIAKRMASLGANVTIADIDMEAAEQTGNLKDDL
jgi:NAD(P)-dependent dehydrogenase (short-subunit alcohol dehydrogenase family)